MTLTAEKDASGLTRTLRPGVKTEAVVVLGEFTTGQFAEPFSQLRFDFRIVDRPHIPVVETIRRRAKPPFPEATKDGWTLRTYGS